MGEKFAANPVTGTGSLSVPIAVSPGRAGFGPELTLSYDSGGGNTPHGVGMQVPIQAVSRDTHRGAPQYGDDEESDLFILSGAEDLVPVLERVGGRWQQRDLAYRSGADRFTVRRYRPRYEGMFARIERWTNDDTGEVHWRSISKDNVTSLFGTSAESRIFDPARPRRVFSWLISQSYDSRGNVIVYEYKAENSQGVSRSLARERNRTDLSRSSQRYLKRIKYGGRTPYYPSVDDQLPTEWLFEVVFDYGEGHYDPLPPDERGRELARATNQGSKQWPVREDPVSQYRQGFEVRTYRLCRRILMFHHFPPGANGEQSYDGLVSVTEFEYDESPVASYLTSVTHAGFRKLEDGTYLRKALPPLELSYSRVSIDETVRDVDPVSLENAPVGLAGDDYQWVDLESEGLSGILARTPEGWHYKRNLSPIATENVAGDERPIARFGPSQPLADLPAGPLDSPQAQLFDVDQDGQLELVELGSPDAGFFSRTDERGWGPFHSFRTQPTLEWSDPNVRLIDLTFDGRPDVLITEENALTFHRSLGAEGFAPAERIPTALGEEDGPRLVFADGTESIFLASMSGDGVDLVRIRESEVVYYPNCGNGVFGPKVTMDNPPTFDTNRQFDPSRIRLGDIDGYGPTDIIYPDDNGASVYFNQSGNSWSPPRRLDALPEITSEDAVAVVDLFANGTSCLVWSSERTGDPRRPMRYMDLTGGEKPHLLVGVDNNLGVETRARYASSTRFYLEDEQAGRPCITKLPVPVQVVKQVETIDRIGRNCFVTEYAYHDGFLDPVEHDHGFALIEQWDTQHFGDFQASAISDATNVDEASHVPPTYTKTWYHTGAYLRGEDISRHLAREYFGAPPPGAPNYSGRLEAFLEEELLPDTVISEDIDQADTIREACRALKGRLLRREVYAEDGTSREGLPYVITESNYTLDLKQPREGNRHAVLFAHPRETITYQAERDPDDAGVTHDVVLRADEYGNVERSVTIAYPRAADRGHPEQAETHVVLTLNRHANEDRRTKQAGEDWYRAGEDWYRAGVAVEMQNYEVVRPPPGGPRLDFTALEGLVESLVPGDATSPQSSKTIPYEQWDWRDNWDPLAVPGGPSNSKLRLIERVRTRYRADDLTGLLPLGEVESRALPGEAYKLAMTAGLVGAVYGGRVDDAMLTNCGYVHSEGDQDWWIPTGRIHYHHDPNAWAGAELAAAEARFFQPCRFRDPFGTDAWVDYDVHSLLLLGSEDALANRVSSGERNVGDGWFEPRLDYRVLQPSMVTDPNGNRTEVAFDVLGMVVGTAVMGKVDEDLGDLIDHTFEPDLDEATITSYLAAPLGKVLELLSKASTRFVYDVDAYRRTRQQPAPKPVTVSTLARETHHVDAHAAGVDSRVQLSFSYSDGFGRELQKKVYADPGPLVPDGPTVTPRYLRSAWAYNNNKGLPYRRFEPDYTATHRFEFGAVNGVSSILFYDPLDRVVATLHPNQTWEKVTFSAWENTTWDVNDTTGTTADALADPDIGVYLQRIYPGGTGFTSWFDARCIGQLGDEEQAAAARALAHAGTPTTVCHDVLGRAFLSLARNRTRRNGTTIDEEHPTRTEFDVEGNPRAIRDAKPHPTDPNRHRIVMRYDYELLGTQIRQRSMEAGERMLLNDVAGKPAYAWDSRNHRLRTTYDVLQRPTDAYLGEGIGPELLIGQNVYGESAANPHRKNLRGKVVTVFDQAGVVTTPEYDFKGNRRRALRRLARMYDATLDWSSSVAPEPETYTSATRYDALNRPTQLVAPHSDQPGTAISVTQNVYNQVGQLEQVHVWLDLDEEPDRLLDPTTADLHPVADIAYNPKGQHTRLDRGTVDGRMIRTRYSYDRETSRLVGLYTRRGVDAATGEGRSFAGDCDNPTASPPAVGAPQIPPRRRYCGLQNLHYTYDPAGNITNLRDDAQQTVIFKSTRVEPSSEYAYDALYRLITATGREHLGQNGSAIPHSYNDAGRTGLPHPAEQNALGRYAEEYFYDEVGNFLTMRHHRTDAQNPGWSRTYAYEEDSLLEPGEFASNRLTSTSVGSQDEIYSTSGDGYDAHGNMLRMPHLQEMRWDFRDQLQMTRRQVVNAGDADGQLHDGERTWYVYDSAGQRVRKVTESASGVVKHERIYLGGLEIYRRKGGTPLVRETLHVMDGMQRVALVETRTNGTEPGVLRRVNRYQLGNHLGSAILELTDGAAIISYEEFTPWGSTVYEASRGGTEAPKRYRFTGKECDEESGLYYHCARYYAPWLGRWSSVDPALSRERVNGYWYAADSPLQLVDPDGRAELPANVPANVQDAAAAARRWLSDPHLDRGTAEVTLYEAQSGQVVKEITGDIYTHAESVRGSLQGARKAGQTLEQAMGSPELGKNALDQLRQLNAALQARIMTAQNVLTEVEALRNDPDPAVAGRFAQVRPLRAMPGSAGLISTRLREMARSGEIPGHLAELLPPGRAPGVLDAVSQLPLRGKPPAVVLGMGRMFDPEAWREATRTAKEGLQGLRSTMTGLAAGAAKIAGAVGVVFSVVGAYTVGDQTSRELQSAGSSPVTSGLYGGVAIVGAFFAGVVDDAAMVSPYAPIVMESWEQHHAGPAQRAVGEGLTAVGLNALRFDRWLGLK